MGQKATRAPMISEQYNRNNDQSKRTQTSLPKASWHGRYRNKFSQKGPSGVKRNYQVCLMTFYCTLVVRLREKIDAIELRDKYGKAMQMILILKEYQNEIK